MQGAASRLQKLQQQKQVIELLEFKRSQNVSLMLAQFNKITLPPPPPDSDDQSDPSKKTGMSVA